MSENELAIINLSLDFLSWLLPVSQNFPVLHRQTITLNLLGAALDLHEHMEAASQAFGSARLILLSQVETDLGKIRLYLRMTEKMSWLPAGEYLKAVQKLAEVNLHLRTWSKHTQVGAGIGGQFIGPI